MVYRIHMSPNRCINLWPYFQVFVHLLQHCELPVSFHYLFWLKFSYSGFDYFASFRCLGLFEHFIAMTTWCALIFAMTWRYCAQNQFAFCSSIFLLMFLSLQSVELSRMWNSLLKWRITKGWLLQMIDTKYLSYHSC